MGTRTSKSDSQENQAVPKKTTLFESKQCGPYYRIPALIYIDDAQTFLAFAEKRTSPDDCDATLLVMSRGTRQNGEIKWSSAEELSTACLKCYRTMNPCPVYEKESKTVFLFFICVWCKTTEKEQICCCKNKIRLCYVTSSDNGQNWSSTIDLTRSVIGDEIANWATFAVGPGHGIQMKSGRLIIPAYFYENIHSCCCCFAQWPSSYAFAFYSDDGKNWHFGKKVSTKSCECVMAEIIDKNDSSYLYCNARSTEGYRVEVLSKNGGKDFDLHPVFRNLEETGNGCQGSVLSITAPQDQATKNWLLYSHPTNKTERRDLGIYLNKSPLSDSEWNKPWIIHHGPSAYSDLTTCEEPDRFACLMECGKKSELEEIAFVEFSLQDIMNNQ